jgi:large subunit ribosomal protein L21
LSTVRGTPQGASGRSRDAQRAGSSAVFAIIQSGGRQVKVAPGDVISVDRFDAVAGDEVTIDQVLVLEKDGGEVLAGAPYVANVKIVGVVDGESRGPKIRVFKKKRRKGMRRTKGHRATYTLIKIKDIIV